MRDSSEIQKVEILVIVRDPLMKRALQGTIYYCLKPVLCPFDPLRFWCMEILILDW